MSSEVISPKGGIDPEAWQVCTLESACQVSDPNAVASTLEVAQPVSLQKQGSDQRGRVMLVGWHTGRYLLLDAPGNLLTSGHLFKGDQLWLRYLNRGLVYGCTAQILDLAVEHGLMVVSWPSGLELVAVGSQPRVALSLAAKLQAASDEHGQKVKAEVVVCDLSLGGCQVRLAQDQAPAWLLKPPVDVEVAFSLPGEDAPNKRAARVRNVQVRGSEVLLGCSFDEGAGPTPEQIASLVQSGQAR